MYTTATGDFCAARTHERGPEEGKTCIDCPRRIAHKAPEEVAEETVTR